jgi:hypothetical protein
MGCRVVSQSRFQNHACEAGTAIAGRTSQHSVLPFCDLHLSAGLVDVVAASELRGQRDPCPDADLAQAMEGIHDGASITRGGAAVERCYRAAAATNGCASTPKPRRAGEGSLSGACPVPSSCSRTGGGPAAPRDQGDKSRMNREVHVRIRGSRGVQLPPTTWR